VPSLSALTFAARSDGKACGWPSLKALAWMRGRELRWPTLTEGLSEDLAKGAALVDDEGRRYPPIAWRGDPPGGHHRTGILQFSAPAVKSRAVELQIDGVGGGGRRIFRWELN
jgi:hypothetical protein